MTLTKRVVLLTLLAGLCFAADEPDSGIQLGDFLNPIGAFASHSANKGWGGWHISTNASQIPSYLIAHGTAAWNPTDTNLYVYNGSAWALVLNPAQISGMSATQTTHAAQISELQSGAQDITFWGIGSGGGLTPVEYITVTNATDGIWTLASNGSLVPTGTNSTAFWRYNASGTLTPQ